MFFTSSYMLVYVGTYILDNKNKMNQVNIMDMLARDRKKKKKRQKKPK